MPLWMVQNDITKMKVDAVVTPSDRGLRQRGRIGREVFLAAGVEELTRACRAAGGCREGDALITEGFGLPARYIIHAACPRRGGVWGKKRSLERAYRAVLELAKEHHLETIAFPLLSSRSGHPQRKAAGTAIEAIKRFLMEEDMTVYLVFDDRETTAIGRELSASIQGYMDSHYVEEKDKARGMPSAPASPEPLGRPARPLPMAQARPPAPSAPSRFGASSPDLCKAPCPSMAPAPAHAVRDRKLEDLLRNVNETFSQMLLRLIDERGLKDSVVYRKANIDRRLFSKIRKDISYTPTKKTVLAFAIALELSLDEARDLLMKAGYAFSNSSRSDIIISYFIENRRYDIFEINEVLFSYDQPILGE